MKNVCNLCRNDVTSNVSSPAASSPIPSIHGVSGRGTLSSHLADTELQIAALTIRVKMQELGYTPVQQIAILAIANTQLSGLLGGLI